MTDQRSRLIVGYTTGVYDLFHVGHLNLLRRARGMCDRLIVGVTTDELSLERKGKIPVIPLHERMAIVDSIRYVDLVVPQESMDKFGAWRRLQFDLVFVGDDWFGNPQWTEYQSQFAEVGVKVAYLPHTLGTSSSAIRGSLQDAPQLAQDPSSVGLRTA